MRWLARILLVLLVVLILAAAGAYFYGDAAARQAIERAGTYATGTRTQVDSVSLGVFSGRMSLKDMTIDNPGGFSANHFLTLGRGSVKVSLGSLMSKTVKAPRLHLANVNLNLEQADGKRNYQVILDHLRKLSSSRSDKSDKKWVIQELEIDNVNVAAKADLPGLGNQGVHVHIPDIKLENVRSDSTAKLQAEVLRQILTSVIRQMGGQLPREMLADLRGQIANIGDLSEIASQQMGQARKQVGKASEQVKRQANEMGTQAGEAAQKAGKQVQEAIKGVGDGLGGLGGKQQSTSKP